MTFLRKEYAITVAGTAQTVSTRVGFSHWPSPISPSFAPPSALPPAPPSSLSLLLPGSSSSSSSYSRYLSAEPDLQSVAHPCHRCRRIPATFPALTAAAAPAPPETTVSVSSMRIQASVRAARIALGTILLLLLLLPLSLARLLPRSFRILSRSRNRRRYGG